MKGLNSLPDFLINILRYFAIYDYNEQLMLFSILIAWLVILVLRVYLAAKYKGQITL